MYSASSDSTSWSGVEVDTCLRSSFIVTAVKSSSCPCPGPLTLRYWKRRARRAARTSFSPSRANRGSRTPLLQAGAQGRLELHQRPGDPVSHGARLPGLAAACDVDQDVELVVRLGQDQRSRTRAAARRCGSTCSSAAVDLHAARTGSQIHAGGGRLPPARRVVLHHRHARGLRLGFKPGSGSARPLGWCGWLGPGVDLQLHPEPAPEAPSGASPSPTIRRRASASPSASVPRRPA